MTQDKIKARSLRVVEAMRRLRFCAGVYTDMVRLCQTGECTRIDLEIVDVDLQNAALAYAAAVKGEAT